MRKVLEYLAAHGEISDQELQALLEIKRTRAYTLVKQMERAGLVEISGRGVRRKIRTKNRCIVRCGRENKSSTSSAEQVHF